MPAGSYKLTDRDTWTWVEIPVEGVGWVTVDPTPVATTTAASPPPEQVRASPTDHPQAGNALCRATVLLTPSPSRPTSRITSQSTRIGRSCSVSGSRRPSSSGSWRELCWCLPSAGDCGRVARHQPADPSLLAAGAWLELLDGLSRLGVEVSPSATSSEVADQVAERFGEDFGPPARFVGDAADQALYSTVWPLEEARARTAWDSQRQLYKAMRHTVGFEAAAQTLLRVGTAPARPSQQAHPQAGRVRGTATEATASRATVIRTAVIRAVTQAGPMTQGQ